MKYLFLLLIMTLSMHAQAGGAVELIAEAETLQQEARDKLYSWVATTRLIDEAKAAQLAGETEKAEALAIRAIKLANASLAQEKKEAATWNTRVVR